MRHAAILGSRTQHLVDHVKIEDPLSWECPKVQFQAQDGIRGHHQLAVRFQELPLRVAFRVRRHVVDSRGKLLHALLGARPLVPQPSVLRVICILVCMTKFWG